MQGIGQMVRALCGLGQALTQLGCLFSRDLPPTLLLGTPSSSFAYFSFLRKSKFNSHHSHVSPGVLLQLITQETLCQEVACYQDPG